MYICIITTVHNATDARIFYRQARSLSSVGHNVTIIAPKGMLEEEKTIKFIIISPTKIKWLRLFTNFKYLKKALNGRHDLYHFHDPDFLFFGVLLKIISGKKVIFDVHEDFSKVLLEAEWIPSSLRRIFSIKYNFIEAFCSLFFDGIITATEHIATRFNARKTVVIHNYPHSKIDFDTKIEKRPNSLVFIGGITRIRGLYQFLEGLRILRQRVQVTIDVYGSFTDPDYESEMKQEFGQDWIKFHGFVDNTKVYDKLAQYELGVLPYLPVPNHLEALPTKIFEYMMTGLPIVCSDFPLWHQIVEGNKIGKCFDPLNPENISEILYEILNDKSDLEGMSTMGKILFREKYNWEMEEKELFRFYERFVN